MDSIRLGEKAVYGGIVVGIVGVVVGVTGVVGNRSVGSDLLSDPFPITQVAIWQRHNVSFLFERHIGTR
jgi:hypothetical protein